MTIGAPIDVLAWQRALAVEPLIVVTAFTPTRDDLRVTVQAAAARYAIPVRLHARVSRRWHDVFDFTVEPHPIKAGDTSMVRHPTAPSSSASPARRTR